MNCWPEFNKTIPFTARDLLDDLVLDGKLTPFDPLMKTESLPPGWESKLDNVHYRNPTPQRQKFLH